MKRSKRARPSGDAASARSAEGNTRQVQRNSSPPVGQRPAASPQMTASCGLTILAAGLIALAAVAAYHNSFAGPFIYDDLKAIVENRTIRRLWPIWPVLSPPRSGVTVAGRPLLNLSLAVNYALSGLNVRAYHVTNLAIHIAAALLLFGILRRTLLTCPLRDRFGRASSLLALAGAMLWAVHPLQTESVTYIIQRAESLMGLFYLLTLYCVIRGAGPAQWLWYVAAVLACLLGMATKEVMATAPLAVLLYDRTFLAGSFAEAWRRRWGLYVGLATTWGVLAYVVLSAGLIGHYSELGAPDPWSYARTQPGVILHYLRLSVWPSTLCLQYDWPVPNGLAEILPGALVVALLLAATAWGLMKRKAYGFLGAWFLLILAPTSSILPLGQLAADHRMYLPLAAVAALGAASGHVLWEKLLSRSAGQGGQSPFSPDMTPGRVGWWAATKGTVPGAAPFLRWAAPMAVLAAALGALGSATVQRNSDYRSLLAIWQDTVHKDPGNALAHTNLAVALDAAGRTAEAIEHFHVALRLKPNLAEAHANLGIVLANHGRLDEAIKQYQQALQLKPRFAESHHALADALAGLGRTDEAIEHYRQAVRLKPDYAEAHHAWADALAAVGSTEEALEHYRHALRLNPENAEAHNNLGIALLQSRQPGEAIAFPGGLENQARFRRGPQ